MKKNGFTLAEVLITLAIIGVVATMTLPALMTNTAEQQARTGLKKGINTLTEAAQMNLALENWDFGTAIETNDEDGITTDTNLGAMNFDSLIGNRTSIDYSKGVDLPSPMVSSSLLTGLKAVYFKDGTALYYNPSTVVANAGQGGNAVQFSDGLPKGYVVFFDTNGASGPNTLSNCTGAAIGAKEEVTTLSDVDNFVTAVGATSACANKKNRVIKDIFAVRLRGNIAQPEGAASTWVLNGDVRGSGSGS